MPFPSSDNCRWCGFLLSRGEHGIIGPAEIEGNGTVQCKVPFDVAPHQVPRVDVISGVGYFRRGMNANGELIIDRKEWIDEPSSR